MYVCMYVCMYVYVCVCCFNIHTLRLCAAKYCFVTTLILFLIGCVCGGGGRVLLLLLLLLLLNTIIIPQKT